MICKITFRQEKFCLRSCLTSVEITGFGQLLLERIITTVRQTYIDDRRTNLKHYIDDDESGRFFTVPLSLIFRLFMDGKNRNQIAVYLKNGQVLTPTFYLKQHDRGTAKSRQLNQQYLVLKDEVKEVEQIRKSVYSILRQEQREQQPRRTQEVEL